MNKFFKILGIITLVTTILFPITACGGDSPKGLAKQSVELLLEGKKLYEGGKPDKKTEENYRKRLDSLTAKYKNLSADDKKIYDAEIVRLDEEWKKKNKK